MVLEVQPADMRCGEYLLDHVGLHLGQTVPCVVKIRAIEDVFIGTRSVCHDGGVWI